MKDMIRTLHPEKKQGVNISREKYEIIRKAILTTLRTQKEITFMNLSRAVEKEVNGTFENIIGLYHSHSPRPLHILLKNEWKCFPRSVPVSR